MKPDRCEPRFPAKGVLLDANVLVRFFKCGALDKLKGTVELHLASQVAREFKKIRAQRDALESIEPIIHRVEPGSATWEQFSRLRGHARSTRDLGEDESLAIALAEANEGNVLPFVTYDKGATSDAERERVVTLDFLDTLAWLVGCGVLSCEEADAIEVAATSAHGWKRPASYPGSIESIRAARQSATAGLIGVWRVSSS